MVGYIGLVMLVVAYIALLSKRFRNWFIPIDIFASFLLTAHAMLLKDIPFLVVNGLITVILTIKLIKQELI